MQRPFVLRLEAPYPLKRLKQGVLDKVLRVGHVAGPAWQASAGPAPQGREVTGEQRIDSRPVAGAGLRQQLKRRFGVVHVTWEQDVTAIPRPQNTRRVRSGAPRR